MNGQTAQNLEFENDSFHGGKGIYLSHTTDKTELYRLINDLM